MNGFFTDNKCVYLDTNLCYFLAFSVKGKRGCSLSILNRGYLTYPLSFILKNVITVFIPNDSLQASGTLVRSSCHVAT